MTSEPRCAKPEPLLQIPDYGHAILEGSAGTGKTHTLEQLVVDLVVARGVGIDEILVVTISSEAAAALKRRVRETMVSLLALRESETRLSVEQCWVLDATARERLRRALLDFDLARIGTVHDWASGIVAENPFLVQSLFERELVDERTLFSRALAELIADERYRPYMSAWLDVKRSSNRELEAVLFRAANLRGRLTPRFDPESILRAARALPDLRRLDATVADVVPRNAQAKIERHLDQLATALGTDDVALLLAELEGVDLPYLSEKLEPLLDSARALDGDAVPLAAAMVDVLLPPLIDRVGRMKRESGLECSEDAVQVLVDALESSRGPELVRTLLRQHRAVLVDDFQETSEAQWRLLRRVFVDTAGHHLLRVVCDPKGFAGALDQGDHEVFRRAKRTLAARSVVVPLVDSFRATPDLVEGLNLIFDQSQEHPFFTGWARYEKTLLPGRSASRLLGADLAPKPPVILLRSDSDHAKRVLALGIADEVRAITGGAPDRHLVFGDRGKEERLRLSDILVLTATEAEVDEIARALDSRGIETAFYRKGGLFQSREAEDVFALLAAIESPGDRSKRVRALLTPFFDLSLRELERPRDRNESDPLVLRLKEWREVAEQRSSAVLFDRILEDTGIRLRGFFSPESKRRAAQIEHIFEVLAEDRRTARATLPELTKTLEAYIGGRGRPRGRESNVVRLHHEDAVRVSTLVAGKGLEAPVVFLYAFSAAPSETVHVYHDPGDGLRSGFVGDRRRAPAAVRAAIEREDLEKSQRLLYVALTRARARLYLPLVPDVLAKRSVYAQLHHRLQDLLGIFPIQPVSNGSPVTRPVEHPLDTWHPPVALLEEPAAPGQKRATAAPETSSLGEAACLREVLAAVPLEAFGKDGETLSLSEWRKREGVERVVLRALRSSGVDRRWRADLERLAYAAFATPLSLFESRLERGLWAAGEILRSVDYVLAGDASEGRGVAASIDVVFRHEGLSYLCSFDGDGHSLRRVAREQHCVAALAMLRISNEKEYLACFGGVLSCSPASMPSGGVSFDRPTWREVLRLRAELFREKRS